MPRDHLKGSSLWSSGKAASNVSNHEDFFPYRKPQTQTQTMKRNTVSLLTLLNLLAMFATASAQVKLTGTSYTQNFDDLGSGLPPGWSVRTGASATGSGTEVTLVTSARSWSATSGQFANFASTASNEGTNFLGTEASAFQAASTNRCLGVRQTSSFGDPGAAFVLQLQNTLGFAGFQLAVDLNMLSVQNRSNAWIIDYGIGDDPVSFTPVWTNADPCVFGCTPTAVSFGGALDDQAQPVWIRVVALEASAGGGSRDTFGLDNWVLSYGATSAVSPVPLRLELDGNAVVLTWSDPSFALQASPSLTEPFTNMPAALSPHTVPLDGTQLYFRLKAN